MSSQIHLDEHTHTHTHTHTLVYRHMFQFRHVARPTHVLRSKHPILLYLQKERSASDQTWELDIIALEWLVASG